MALRAGQARRDRQQPALPEDRVVFAVGLTWHERDTRGWSAVTARVSDHAERLEGDAFSPYDDELPRLYRWLAPEGLADEDNFASQVEALKGFVVEAFDDVANALSEV